MTCDKCGKELEVIKTDTGGAFLPCGCQNAKQFIDKVLAYIPNPPLMAPQEYHARKIVEQSNYIFKLSVSLKIAIEALELLRDKMPRCECVDGHSIADTALGNINEVTND